MNKTFENIDKEIDEEQTLQLKIFQYIKLEKWDLVSKIINDYNIDFNIKDQSNIYILEYAIIFNKINIVKLLVEKGARIDILDESNRSILYNVIKYSYIDILKYLIDKDKEIVGNTILEIADNEKNIPLFYAIKFYNLDAIKLIMDNMYNYFIKNNDGNSAIHIAVLSNDFNIFKYILHKIKNINLKNNKGETCFHLIIINKCYDMLKFILTFDDLDFNAKVVNLNYTPLHYLCKENDSQLFSIIADKINLFDGNVQDKSGNIFLHYFINNILKNFKNTNFSNIVIDIFKIITNINFNYNLYNIDGDISCHLMLNNLKLFIDNFSIIVNNLIVNSNLNLQNNLGESCFFIIVKKNYWKDISNLLVNKKLDIFIINNTDNTIFDYLSENDMNEFITLITNSYINQIRTRKKTKFIDYWDNRCKKNINLQELNEVEKESIDNIDIKNNKDICFDIFYNKLSNYIKQYKKTKKNNGFHSYPIKNIYPKLIGNYPNVNLSTYTGSTLDVISGLIYLSNKHQNSFSSLKLINIDSPIVQCKVYCNIVNFEIYWTDFQLHIPTNKNNDLRTLISTNINSKKYRFFIAPLAIEINLNNVYKAHANFIIIDFENKQIERFEPHGSEHPVGMNYNPSLLDYTLKNKFNSFNINFEYFKPSDYLPKIGFQTKEISELKNDFIGDPNGFCALWSTWWADIRLSFPQINRLKLQKLLFKEIANNNLSYKKLIRDYSYYVTKIVDNILLKSDININEWNNDKIASEPFKIQKLNDTIISEILPFI